jgi:curli biogenesis system outer membrane secretion channel CsgG
VLKVRSTNHILADKRADKLTHKVASQTNVTHQKFEANQVGYWQTHPGDFVKEFFSKFADKLCSGNTSLAVSQLKEAF